MFTEMIVSLYLQKYITCKLAGVIHFILCIIKVLHNHSLTHVCTVELLAVFDTYCKKMCNYELNFEEFCHMSVCQFVIYSVKQFSHKWKQSVFCAGTCISTAFLIREVFGVSLHVTDSTHCINKQVLWQGNNYAYGVGFKVVNTLKVRPCMLKMKEKDVFQFFSSRLFCICLYFSCLKDYWKETFEFLMVLFSE
jgi:hypothetical protein